ncbi:hypothetical protein [Chloracidobacterium aggregatum]|uniref:DUF4177 domain-containing protein n=1 Tax=Chloracidobacterium sp. N TaxID=2821540 RepID=A0ABX8B8U5_9BACT|nr:hypothetical protein [Chloracidobacterium aggregatum]QUV95506.1 hypothetical protein J8C05_11745 [Chloracidobacterium sp. N]QUV98728.1 hypothetical protein J8C00_12970 [Chloracidobacterium sp. E]
MPVKSLFGLLLFFSLSITTPAWAQMARNPERPAASDQNIEYRLLATSKTSTMEREMNEAAREGFRFEGVMGGETAFGGNECVVIMSRTAPLGTEFEYKLLATSRTSTMQKELAEAGCEGFRFAAMAVAETAFGGREVVVILYRPGTLR